LPISSLGYFTRGCVAIKTSHCASAQGLENKEWGQGKESFRVMVISATYGHGEGVVGSVGVKAIPL
jgi:hypothetical protein